MDYTTVIAICNCITGCTIVICMAYIVTKMIKK